MKKTLLSLFSVFALSFASLADQCTTSATASGNDDGTTIATVTNFSCAGASPITAASISGSGINTASYSNFEIWVNGALVSTQGSNFSNFDLTAYLPLTNVQLILVDDPLDGYPFDSYTINADVTLTYTPSCSQPTAFTLQSATNNSATFGFTAGGAETSWSIEYGAIGFTPGQGTMTTITANPATISGLNPNSFYQAVIRAICGPGDTSAYTLPITFNTYNLGQFIDWNSTCSPIGFTDISSTGTNLNLGDDDGVNVAIPFGFVYQNTLISNCWANNNGKILFGSTATAWTNTTMATAPDGLYPLWNDYYGSTSPQGVYSQVIGTAPNRKLIIQWDVLAYSSGVDGDISFQVVIDEATQNIYYVYDDVDAASPANSNNGIDATIGFAGPTTDVTISHNNANYLTNNTCVKIYNTDCPTPKNFLVTAVTPDEIQIDWTSGAANETEWTIIYGEAGFDPLTDGITMTGLTSSDASLTGLTQLTSYDIYIYANCSGVLTSLGYMNTVQTLPLCTIPSALGGSTLVDSIKVNWTFVPTPGYDATSFNIQYGPTGFNLYSGTIVSADVTPNDTIVNPAFVSGMVYDVYVQSVCGLDSSIYAGPFTVTMPLQNDTVCGAELLQVDGTVYTFNNTGATVSTGEALITPPLTSFSQNDGWGSSGIFASTWFKFVAPASGSVRLNFTNSNYQGKAAVYKVVNCGDYAAPNFTLVSANDNGWNGAPNFTACGLNPGEEYYILHSKQYTWTTNGNYSIKLTPIVLEAGAPTTVINACLKDTVDLFTTISGQQVGGTWTWITPTAGLTDSLFNTDGSASQIFNFEYRVVDGCAYDSVIGQVKVFPASSAGNDGTVSVCRNQPVDLLSGLTGNVDHGGTWINPSNQPIASSAIVGSNIPGQFNYSYITGNGVCPNDTAIVLVNVLSNCNYLTIEEMVFENMTVYPNPTSGVLYIANPSSTESFDVNITDANGRVVYSANAIVNGTKIAEINLSGKETGIYFVKVSNSTAQKTYRVIIQ